MNTSLDHLPESKREQLKAIASVIRSRAPVDMVILFGSYARGNWVEDLATGYFSDFDLMAVVATPEQAKDAVLWGEITAEIRRLSGRTPVTLVVHDVKELNHEIRMGQFFFADVVKEGILLYDSKHFILAKPKALTAEERIKLALYNFDYWFHSASEFWRGSVYYAGRGLGPHSAFLLHQAAERYFHAMLLVYTGYKPRTHDLEELAEKTAPLHPAMEGALPRIEENDKHHFDLLKRAYIEARYSKAYRVTSAELEVMRAHVLDLASRVRTACAKQISVMSPTGEIPELSAMPAVTDVSALPELPDLGDSKAVNAWREAVAQMSEERAEKSYEAGRQEERARAIVEVLRRRGIPLTDEQAQKIADCRDQATLTHWWDRAWSVSSADEL